jgi:hypothetical protein
VATYGGWFVGRGQVERGVALAAAAVADQKAFVGFRPYFGRQLAQLEGLLPANDFAAAVARGKTLDVDTVVAELLVETGAE